MKRGAALLVLLLLFVGTLNGQGIEFHKQVWDSVLTEAKKQDKLVFVDCYTTWCGPCKKMDKNVFPQEKVGEFYNDKFINVKLDMEKGIGKEVREKYSVKAFPTYLFVNGDGELVHRSKSAMPAEDFIEVGKTALDPSENLMGIRRQYQKGDRSPELIRDYLKILEKSTKGEKYQEVLAWYVHAMPTEKLFTIENFDLLTAGTEANMATVRFLAKHRDDYEQVVGRDRYLNAALHKMRIAFYDILKNSSEEQLMEEAAPVFEYVPELAKQAKDFATIRLYVFNGEQRKAKEKSLECIADYFIDSPNSVSTQLMARMLLRNIARGDKVEDKDFYTRAADITGQLLEQKMESDEYKIRDYYALFLYRAGEVEKAKQQAQLVVDNASQENVKRLYSKREVLAE